MNHLNEDEIIQWLQEENPSCLKQLWAKADETRALTVGSAVHFRGLLEISNYCRRLCGYCGLNAKNTSITRYRMTIEEILQCAKMAESLGYGTVVLQAGEDFGLSSQWVESLIQSLRTSTSLAITLSLGERTPEELVTWKKAGAHRYLLRFETSDEKLYPLIHPDVSGKPTHPSDRIDLLKQMAVLGYEIGSGVMIGIPGQTYRSLAKDLLCFRLLDLDMIGVGPYIAHPDTALFHSSFLNSIDPSEQVPATELMTYKVIALARLLCPEANIPSTTALATINKMNGRELGLQRGANIVMPNLTPPEYRIHYEIYPNKACIRETAQDCHLCLSKRVTSLGRTIGKGQGGRRKQPSSSS